MFSVVIPLFNKKLSIRQTIQSVLDQTFKKFELIIVNDGSTDGSQDVVREFTDPRIRLINQKNSGVSAARNRGIREARYDWIAFLDGDDLWTKDHLEEVNRMITLFPNEKVFTTSYRTDLQNEPKEDQNSFEVQKLDNFFYEAMKGSVIGASRGVIHKQCFDEAGGFNESLTIWEDKDLWLRLARKYDFVKSQKITSIYRTKAENKSFLFFNIYKHGLFHYNFDSSTSEEETLYVKDVITTWLRDFLKKGKLRYFFITFNKHKGHIKLTDIFKKWSKSTTIKL